MSKFFVALLVVSLVAFVTAFDDDDDVSSLIGSDDGGDMLGALFKPFSSFGADFAKNFKAPPGGKGEAHSSSISHEEKTVNGKKVEDETKKDVVDNINGDIVNEEHTST